MMGKQNIIDKSQVVHPLTTITSITPASTISSVANSGSLPIGNYKGVPAFWDLDKAVNQPLVAAEKAHILGLIDGREEDYDLQTLSVALGEAVSTDHTATLVVPSGQVWYIYGVEGVVPASGGANIVTYNWRSSLWTDRAATPNAAGQAFHANDVNFGVGGGTQYDEFCELAPWFADTNKPVQLRAPAGTIFTCTFTNTGAVAAATVTCTFKLFGYIGKTLVS